MKVSVVITTFNGEKYIIPLLNSIKYQTYKIDEVIIADDVSTDGTFEIIAEYIKRYQLNWQLKINETNLGWIKNFKNALLSSNGDYIFPCDQDDIWMNDKVEKMVQIMDDNSHISVLSSNYQVLVDKKGAKKNRHYISNAKRMINNDKIELVSIKPRSLYVLRPGCTYCIRKEMLSSLENFSFADHPHDAIFWRSSLIYRTLYNYNRSTIVFRRHTTNASKKKSNNFQSIINTINYYSQVLDLLETGNESISNEKIKIENSLYINNWQKFIKLRKDMFEKVSILKWIHIAIKYRSFYASLKSLINDLVILINKKFN